MRDLEDGPKHFMLLLAFMARIFGVLEFVLEFEKGVLDVLEAFGRGLAVLCCADCWHVVGLF